MQQRRVRGVVVAGLVVALLGPLDGVDARSLQGAPWIGETDQVQLATRLRQSLPPGWTVTPGPLGTVPDRWRSRDPRTFRLEARRARQSFRVWFVPIDWIGIQPDRTPQRVYWEGVLSDGRFKALTPSGPFAPAEALMTVPSYAALSGMKMTTASLVNSGWPAAMGMFGARLDEVDAQTSALVRDVCAAQACRDSAAYSLIILGVPARSVTLDCVEHGRGIAQAACASALAFWNVPEALPVLRALVADPATSPLARRYAALSLVHLGDRQAGPALLRALTATKRSDRDTSMAIADAIGRVRYRPAGSAVLTRLETETDRRTADRYTAALAALHYQPAIPAIEKWSETTRVTGEWIEEATRDFPGPVAELALVRLTGVWGAPVGGLRLHVVPSGASRPRRLAALFENVGDSALEVAMVPGTWTVDGRVEPIDRTPIDGNAYLDVGAVGIRYGDVSRLALAPGRHTVTFALGGATSNLLTVEVGGAR